MGPFRTTKTYLSREWCFGWSVTPHLCVNPITAGEKYYYSDKLLLAQNDPQANWKMINNILKPNQIVTVFNLKVYNNVTSKKRDIYCFQ